MSLIQQQKAQQAPQFKATRALCVSEGFWNLAFVTWLAPLLYLVPYLYPHKLPAIAWATWPTVILYGLLVLYRGALALRWFWRLKYLSQPAYVEPTHWQDTQPLSKKRLVISTICALIGGLLMISLVQGRAFDAIFWGYYLAIPFLIISVIAGWKHLKEAQNS